MAEQDLELDTDVEGGGKSKKKLFIIIGAVVVILLGAVGGMFAMGMFGGDDAPTEETAGEEGESGDEKSEDGEEGGEEEIGEEALYLPLEPPFVLNFEGKSRVKYMQIALVAMSRNKKAIDMAKTHNPAIRNELTFLLSGQKFDEIVTADGKEQLKEEIMDTINAILKENGVGSGLEKIYFTSFVMQ